MRKRKNNHSYPSPKQISIITLIATALFFVLVILNEGMGGQLPLPSVAQVQRTLDMLYQTSGLTPSRAPVQGDLLVHFVDVGQADCQLIQTPQQNILIDAGDIGDGPQVISYLRAQGVERVDLLIATHPHADHIGGMSDVIQEFEIDKILFSEVPESILPTSKTYQELLNSIEQKKLRITKAKPGTQYDLGGGASMAILGPIEDYDNLNDTSVVCRLDYGENSFLFMGDAEIRSEEDLLNTYSKETFKADVLKLGHHGSDTSSGEKWLDAIRPDYAIAEVGYDNKYGHPNPQIIQRLKERGIKLYRTDQNGTIVAASDGKNLTFVSEKSA